MKRIAYGAVMGVIMCLWLAWAYVMVGAPYFPEEWLEPRTEIH